MRRTELYKERAELCGMLCSLTLLAPPYVGVLLASAVEKRRQGPLPYLLSSFCRPLSNKKKECEVKETFCSVYQLECCITLSSSEDGRDGHIYLLRGSYSLGGPQGSKICQRHSRQSLLFFFLFFIPISATRNVCSRHSLYTHTNSKKKPWIYGWEG